MNVFAVLKKDHQGVSDLMRKIRQTSDRAKQTRQELFARVKAELEAHSEAEEEVFYPALEEHDELRDLVAEAHDEHEEIKRFLEELDAMSTDDEDWKGRFELLMESVEHHVKEEEGEIFRVAKLVLSGEQLEALAEDFSAAKEQALRG